MSDLSFYTIIVQLFEELDLLLKDYVYNGYGALASYLKTPLGLSVTLYFIILGISMTNGWIEMRLSDFIKTVFKISLIYMFAMHWDAFSLYVVQGIQGTAGEIGDVLISATPIPIPHFAGEGIDGALQSVFIEVTKIGAWTWDMGNWHNMGPCFTALLIWGFGYVLLLVGIFEILLSKIMLAVLFTTAPLFVMCCLFKQTKGFFERWLGAIVGFALLLIFVSAVLGLALNLMQWGIGATYADKALHINLVGFIPVMLLGFLGLGMILKVSALAQSIGGTVTTDGAAALIGAGIGYSLGRAWQGTSAAKNMLPSLSFGGGSSGGNVSSGNTTQGNLNSLDTNSMRDKLVNSNQQS